MRLREDAHQLPLPVPRRPSALASDQGPCGGSHGLGAWALALVVGLAGFSVAGCARRPQVNQPPPVTEPVERPASGPGPPGLVAFLVDERPSGGAAWLVWEATEADSVVIDNGIGEVLPEGRLQLPPTTPVTYRVVAGGPGGFTEREVRIEPGRPGHQGFLPSVEPVYFRFDSRELEEAARRLLDQNIAWLTLPENLSVSVLVKGYNDPGGTDEYGHALGDVRASVVRNYMIDQGMPGDRIEAVSTGEEPARSGEKSDSRGRVELQVSR